MNDREREEARRLTVRVERILRESGGSTEMTEQRLAELLALNERLAAIFGKYDPRSGFWWRRKRGDEGAG